MNALTGVVTWEKAPVPAAADELEKCGQPRWRAELLARRGVSDGDGAEAFLRPDVHHLHDPHLLAGIDDAIARLLHARREGKPVAVVGDYDVDGVSGTALLTAVLRACGLEVLPILPHRLLDGYGFQPVHVERARAKGCRLIVTVDCGTSSHAAVEAALADGIDVVVTDHHLPGEPLPEGVVMINPRQEACRYPFAELSGAGLALKLAMATAAACGRSIDPRILMRVACLGTVADLVPLQGENRVIASVGLDELPRTRSPGLLALLRVARLQAPYTATDVGFRLGPRLNAPGRVGSADPALELLLTRDSHRAFELALELDRRNRERQEWERRVVEEAREHVLGLGELPPILVAWSESWHRGVVGIAAGRLTKEFHRPALLLAVDGDEATGSGRSIPGIHLYDFFSRWRGELPKFGGHAQAIGLSVTAARLPDLRRQWEKEAEIWRDLISTRRYLYELECRPAELTPERAAELERFEPHGEANPKPLIRIPGPLRMDGPLRRFGQGHLEAEAVGEDGGRIRCVGWGWAEREASLTGEIELLGLLERDRYRGSSVLRLVDSRGWAAGL